MDSRLAAFARKRGLVYSRYADDIAFSPDPKANAGGRAYRNPFYIVRITRQILKDYGYLIREDKVRIWRQPHRHSITGIVVNGGCHLPRTLRRRLRAAEHRLRVGETLSAVTEAGDGTPMSPSELQGWQSYRGMVERRHAELENQKPDR